MSEKKMKMAERDRLLIESDPSRDRTRKRCRSLEKARDMLLMEVEEKSPERKCRNTRGSRE